jgi:hypothetical protein
LDVLLACKETLLIEEGLAVALDEPTMRYLRCP